MFLDELVKLTKEGFGKYVDKEEMSKDQVLPPRELFLCICKNGHQQPGFQFF